MTLYCSDWLILLCYICSQTRSVLIFSSLGVVGFSMTEYVFQEEDGTGTVSVVGTAGLTVRVVGGLPLHVHVYQSYTYTCNPPMK